jgi:hypothetical protein
MIAKMMAQARHETIIAVLLFGSVARLRCLRYSPDKGTASPITNKANGH